MARVFMAPGSEPASGSVRPKQPMSSPLAILGRYFFFCSSEPNRKMEFMASELCTDTKLRTPESPRSSSCMMRP